MCANEMLAQVRDLLAGPEPEEGRCRVLTALVRRLDSHLRGGGELPASWRSARPPSDDDNGGPAYG
jgi:hypothetical protein